jgi:hypothetical protein
MKSIIYLFAVFILVSSILADNGKCNCRPRADGKISQKKRTTICCNGGRGRMNGDVCILNNDIKNIKKSFKNCCELDPSCR